MLELIIRPCRGEHPQHAARVVDASVEARAAKVEKEARVRRTLLAERWVVHRAPPPAAAMEATPQPLGVAVAIELERALAAAVGARARESGADHVADQLHRARLQQRWRGSSRHATWQQRELAVVMRVWRVQASRSRTMAARER
eukprot:3474824-Prymnesium_polylepis.2